MATTYSYPWKRYTFFDKRQSVDLHSQERSNLTADSDTADYNQLELEGGEETIIESISVQQEFKSHQKIGQDRFLRKYTYQRGPVFDQSNLPHMNTLRIMYIMQCIMLVIWAPISFIWFGYLQELHTTRCFLNATIHVKTSKEEETIELIKIEEKENKKGKSQKESDTTPPAITTTPKPIENQDSDDSTIKKKKEERQENLQRNVDNQLTEWGKEEVCYWVLYTPVQIWLLNVVIGWMSVQVWPEAMSSENGLTMAAAITIVETASVIAQVNAIDTYNEGFNYTCLHIRGEPRLNASESEKVSCLNITPNMSYVDPDAGDFSTGRLRNKRLFLHIGAIIIDMWVVLGLCINKLVVSVLLLLCFWIFYYRDPTHSPFQLDDDGSSSDDSDSSELL